MLYVKRKVSYNISFAVLIAERQIFNGYTAFFRYAVVGNAGSVKSVVFAVCNIPVLSGGNVKQWKNIADRCACSYAYRHFKKHRVIIFGQMLCKRACIAVMAHLAVVEHNHTLCNGQKAAELMLSNYHGLTKLLVYSYKQ